VLSLVCAKCKMHLDEHIKKIDLLCAWGTDVKFMVLCELYLGLPFVDRLGSSLR
jgi:hypothetical protein